MKFVHSFFPLIKFEASLLYTPCSVVILLEIETKRLLLPLSSNTSPKDLQNLIFSRDIKVSVVTCYCEKILIRDFSYSGELSLSESDLSALRIFMMFSLFLSVYNYSLISLLLNCMRDEGE